MKSSNSPPLHALRDVELFEAFLSGNDDAFTTVYHRYSTRLLGYIHSILGEHDRAADDIFQEAFLRLFRERKKYGNHRGLAPIQNIGGWLFRVARNLSLNQLRSQRYLTELDVSHDERLLVPVEEAHSDLFGERSNDAVLLNAVDAVVKTLPPGLREVFVLREVNGLSYQETAEIIGCTEEAARMRLSRARSAIRRALAPLFADMNEER